MVLLATSCGLDYKSYKLPESAQENPEDVDLVNEIAKIEQELAGSTEETPEAVALEEASEPGTSEEVSEGSTDVSNVTEGSALTGGAVVDEAAVDDLGDDLGEEGVVEREEVEETVQEVVLPELDSAEAPEASENTLNEAVSEEEMLLLVKENELVRLQATVVDPDQDQVTYSFGKPLNDKGEWKTNYGDAGEYLVTLTATDGKLSSQKKVKIVVERVNVPPVISVLKDLVVKEGEKVNFKPEVSDPNKDKVTVSISAPLENGTFATDYLSAGQYEVTVTASDGELSVEKTFKLTVQDVNQLPVVTNLPEKVTVKEGAVLKLEPTVSDLDGEEVKVSISEPVGNDGSWETKYTDHGEYFVTVTADDGKDVVSKRVHVVVEDVNMPPQIVNVVLLNR